MNVAAINDLVGEVTRVYRKGEEVEYRDFEGNPAEPGKARVVEIWGYPHTAGAPEGEALVDMVFVDVGVNPGLADPRKAELAGLLNDFQSDYDYTLSQGPSYIHLGGDLGDQEMALRLMALGQHYGFWNVITPMTLGIPEEEARALAGGGLLLISGYSPGT